MIKFLRDLGDGEAPIEFQMENNVLTSEDATPDQLEDMRWWLDLARINMDLPMHPDTDLRLVSALIMYHDNVTGVQITDNFPIKNRGTIQ